jgi:Polyketide cyclase / dehydrase and lipid transport
MRIEDEALVDAPVDAVWRAIADVETHAAWHPFVTAIAGEHRLNAERTCAVLIGGKPGETRERCVEYAAGQGITWAIEHDTTGFSRLVRDWRAGFRIEPHARGTRVVAVSSFTPRNPLVRALAPVIRRRFHRAQAAILAAIPTAPRSASTITP